jgi:Flp pilus assembly protein TadG
MDSKYSSLAVVAFLFSLSICSSRVAYASPALDPCSLLTQAQVSAALGGTVEAPQRVVPTLCQWSTPKQPNSINTKKVIVTISSERAFGFAKAPVVNHTKAVPANGVGDGPRRYVRFWSYLSRRTIRIAVIWKH